jgi:hypothetical protein
MKRKYEKPAFAKASVTLQAVTASPTGPAQPA